MIGFIKTNAGTLIVLAILLAVVALVIRKLWRDKKAGKSSCGCGCSACGMKGMCHAQKK